MRWSSGSRKGLRKEEGLRGWECKEREKRAKVVRYLLEVRGVKVGA